MTPREALAALLASQPVCCKCDTPATYIGRGDYGSWDACDVHAEPHLGTWYMQERQGAQAVRDAAAVLARTE